ncbi:SUKH-3 domain-containing protein [Kribbella qitaiheensis]|uniref:SUKH-3 domain-containing protein n=1 Tax=Kribbella qitaiheensis TaxID=1544730 RepID=UPI00162546C8|nr:SUKH-3 domain-containing protein [Kribbella qitaiheensis]
MTDFSDAGQRLLSLASWAAGRRVPTDRYESVLVEDGYRWFDLLETFLSEFGGLVLGERFGPFGDILTIDPELATSGIYRERVEEYEEFLAVELVPVGVAARGHLCVMMSPAGSFYGGFDDFLCYLGDNAFEMIRRIATNEGEVLR